MKKTKNTSIKLLWSEQGAQKAAWWNHIDYSTSVASALATAKQHFGAPGVQPGRRWFHRARQEIYYVRSDTKSGFSLLPAARLWCCIYFRDPRDATWFRLNHSFENESHC